MNAKVLYLPGNRKNKPWAVQYRNAFWYYATEAQARAAAAKFD